MCVFQLLGMLRSSQIRGYKERGYVLGGPSHAGPVAGLAGIGGQRAAGSSEACRHVAVGVDGAREAGRVGGQVVVGKVGKGSGSRGLVE